MSMPKGTPRWDSQQLAYLRMHYGSRPAGEIAANLGRTTKAVCERAAKMGLKGLQGAGRFKPADPNMYFQQINSPVKAYVLGLLVADGWVTDKKQVGIDLTEADQSAVAFVRDQLSPGAKLTPYRRKGAKNRSVRFRYTNQQLAADLAAHGIVPRKTRLEVWPEALPAEYVNSFVCGYFDGDGHLDWLPTPYWQVVCANRAFLETMQQHIEVHTGVRTFGPYRQGSIWAIGKKGEAARALDTWIHRDVSGLPRKRLPPMTPANQVIALPRLMAHVLHALLALQARQDAPRTAREVLLYDDEAMTAHSVGIVLGYARRWGLVDCAPRSAPDRRHLWWPTEKAWELHRDLENRMLAERTAG